MRVRRFDWEGPESTADNVRSWAMETVPGDQIVASVREIGGTIFADGDAALLDFTERFDGVRLSPEQMRIDWKDAKAALDATHTSVRQAMELAARNIRAVAEAQPPSERRAVHLPQGQTITQRELPVKAAGVYAPGGRATYPSSVLMCAIPARAAGVERVVVVSPPSAGGRPPDSILAAAALCEVDEIYAVGGAQAVFALAYGTATMPRVDVVVGPGNAHVQEAKRRAFGAVGIDSYAGPSELMVVTGPETDLEWAALDLCAQAEHGAEGPLIATAESDEALERLQGAVERAAADRPGIGDAPLALVLPPGFVEAVDLANAFAPEHLQLFDADAAALADRVATAGCVFAGPYSATAFGDYVAGSNHVLPTGGAGRFSGPLGPGVFRRKIATVEVPEGAAEKLAPHVKALAEAEGFPVHGESAMIRTRR